MAYNFTYALWLVNTQQACCVLHTLFSRIYEAQQSLALVDAKNGWCNIERFIVELFVLSCECECSISNKKKITGEMLQSNSVMNIQQTSHKRLCLGEAEKANELPDSALFISIRQSAILTPFYASKRKLQEVCLNAWLDCQRRARVHKHLHDSQEFLAVSNYSSLVLQ